MTTPPLPQFITARDAALCLGITKSTMYDWIARGYLPSHRVGRLVRIQAADLEAFIRGTRVNDGRRSEIQEAQSTVSSDTGSLD